MKKIIINTSAIVFKETHKSKNGNIARFMTPKSRIRNIELYFDSDGYMREMTLFYESDKGQFNFSTEYKFNEINDL